MCLACRVCAIFTAQEGNAPLTHLALKAHPCGKPREAATRFTWHSPCSPLSSINASCLMFTVHHKVAGRTVLTGAEKGAVQIPRPTRHAGPILVQERVPRGPVERCMT